ncbi:aldehyde dehydrogenase family protein [Brevibacterium sp. H602]|uniref:aldehyde dehydrogenase family protein n=1 Tax=unclassified Brevibacterium TaxID=2614124 RepID=UPI00397C4887
MPKTALHVGQVMNDALLPSDCYRNVLSDNDQIQMITADERVRRASLTGSEGVGAAVAAGHSLKESVLELGGSDPFIVLDSADPDATVTAAVEGRMANSGQSCIASRRLIVVEDLYDEFVDLMTAKMSQFVAGDPVDSVTTMAPLSSEQAARDLMEQVEDAVAHGAKVHTGEHRADRPGAVVDPTVLTGVTEQMRACSEELFGPVVVVYSVANEDEAVALANDSSFGRDQDLVNRASGENLTRPRDTELYSRLSASL